MTPLQEASCFILAGDNKSQVNQPSLDTMPFDCDAMVLVVVKCKCLDRELENYEGFPVPVQAMAK